MSSDMTLSKYMRQLMKNTILFHEGSKNPEMYVVLKGVIELKKRVDSKVVTVNQISQGDFVGERTFFLNEPHEETAVAADDCILLILNQNNFDEVISHNPRLAHGIMTGLYKKINTLEQFVSEHGLSISENPTVESEPNQIIDNESSVNPEQISQPEIPELADQESGMNLTPDIVAKYCFPKSVVCPVCGKKLEINILRDSRLKQTERNNELRTFYQDVDPIFFNIWTCPECYYSMRKTDFEKLTDIQKKNLANHTNDRKAHFPLDFSKKLTYQHILKTHQLAIECYECLGKKDIADKVASIWLNIAWIFDDLGSEEQAIEARKQALTFYNNSFMTSSDRTENQDQKIQYLLGSLSYSLGNIKEAKNHWFKISSNRFAHALLKQYAQNGLEAIKQEEAKKS